MSWKELYDARLSSESNYWINNGIESFNEYLNNAPNKEVISVNDHDYEVTIQSGSSTEDIDNIKIMLSPIKNVFYLGEVVTWGSEKWLIVYFEKKTIENCNKYKIQKCTHIVDFYINNLLQRVPCIIENDVRLYSMMTTDTNYVPFLNDEMIIRIGLNDITKDIEENTKVTIGLRNYVIANVNDVVIPNFLVVKVKLITGQIETPVYNLSILNGDMINAVANTTSQLNVQLKNNDTIISPLPQLKYASSNESIVTVDNTGLLHFIANGNAIITVSYYEAQATVDVVVGNQINSITYNLVGNLQPDDSLKTNMIQTFTANKYVNGVVDNTAKFNFSIEADGVPTNAYAFTVVNDTQCTLKALGYLYYVKIKAVDVSDNTKVIEKTIKLRSIL